MTANPSEYKEEGGVFLGDTEEPPPSYSSLTSSQNEQECPLNEQNERSNQAQGLCTVTTSHPLVIASSNGTFPISTRPSVYRNYRLYSLVSFLILMACGALSLAARAAIRSRVVYHERIVQSEPAYELNSYHQDGRLNPYDLFPKYSGILGRSNSLYNFPNSFVDLATECKSVLIYGPYDGSKCENYPLLAKHLEVHSIRRSLAKWTLKHILEEYPNVVSLVLNFESICKESTHEITLSLESIKLDNLVDLRIENTRKCPSLTPILKLQAPLLEKLTFGDVSLDIEDYAKIKEFLLPPCLPDTGSFRKLSFAYSDLCKNCIFNSSDFNCTSLKERSFTYCNMLESDESWGI